MNNRRLAYDWVDLVNHEVATLDYQFKSLDDNYELRLHKKRILFSKGNTEFSVSPNEWFEDRHKNGNIHEPGLVGWLVALSKVFGASSVKFYDVGALFSYHSFIAEKLFENLEIIAVEGNPISAKFIQTSIKELDLKNIKVDNIVLGKHNGKNTYLVNNFHFFIFNSFKGLRTVSSILFKNLIKSLVNLVGKRFDVVMPLIKEIPSKTLLSLIDTHKPRQIEIFKIDTEGYQAVFLPPAIDPLCDRSAIFLLELDDPKEMEKFGTTNNELVSPFLEQGYSAYWMDHRKRGCKTHQIERLELKHDKNSLLVLMPKRFTFNQNET